MSARLNRLLLVVPAAAGRKGVVLEDLARELNCTPAELRADLDLLACVGVPPFNPDDLIELEERDGRVYVRLAQAFERPTRLSATEAAALTIAGVALAPHAPSVRSALEKLRRAIAPAQLEMYDALLERLKVSAPDASDEIATTLEGACARRWVVEMSYFAGTERTAATRRVKPRALISADGIAYLSAQNEAGEERTYRVDRIAHATVCDESFEPLPTIDLTAKLESLRRFSAHSDLPRAVVRFAPDVANAARAKHPDAVEKDDGSLEARVAWASMPWLVSYLLSWGGTAVVTHPEQARRAVRKAVEDIRLEYRSNATDTSGDSNGDDAGESRRA